MEVNQTFILPEVQLQVYQAEGEVSLKLMRVQQQWRIKGGGAGGLPPNPKK